MSSPNDRQKLRSMSYVLVVTVLLGGLKFLAYSLTGSDAILTDALESLINMVAGGFALFSLYYASRPQDEDHPYGHGKIEFLSAGFEGGLILIAGLTMIGKAIYGFFHPPELEALPTGIALTSVSGAINGGLGYYLTRVGKAQSSPTMTADGQHLLTDTYSSAALVAGLLLIQLSGIQLFDQVLTLLFGGFILFTGYRLIRGSVAGLLDEADYETLGQIIDILNQNRRDKWIDIHNLRVQKYGSFLHIDAHLTLPWYDNLQEVHDEVEALEELVRERMDNRVELFIHADPCQPSSCPICTVQDCPVRQYPYEERVPWKLVNLLPNRQHYFPEIREQE